ncbi:cupredoxin domain-containing protein [Chitinilyticum piscinae]|uniref:Cupredoxin domain-containing protein n=1 Tax=Chitinilyticum piscinae TaxID=2866724 RepID=A0A8J7KC38_9NEIS|nr:cupredoxin domain-containing protein [Chitinilyticum piscinae]MBE9610924.1 cupredoxin domain-containing protein [Chitinilyticum piscinae]
MRMIALALLSVSAMGNTLAADMPTFRIEMNDGKMTPTRIEAPAKTRFRIEVVNKGKTPAEFESLPLRKEKVLAPGVTSSVVVMGASPGEYIYFDDFHPQARGVIVIR